jgi:electron transport complex protein RnfD
VSAERRFVVAPGPHLRAGESTAEIMWWVNGALLPAAAWGVYLFGGRALWVILGSIAGAVAGESLAGRAMNVRHSIADGSAVCTGLLLALTLPPLVSPWAAALGGAFAIVFGKMIFGGLGFNLFNPAMIGRAFMLATFPVVMTTGWEWPRLWFTGPGELHAVTTPTPLVVLREQGPEQAMHLLSGPNGPYANLIMGFRPGSIGEVSVALLGLGALVLLLRNIIKPTIPLSVFAGVALVTSFTGASALHLLSGGLWLGAFFMATDYVTSPRTRDGQIVFGLLVGVLTGLIRVYGGYPEGICYAILVANTMTPALNMWFRPRRTMPVGVPS